MEINKKFTKHSELVSESVSPGRSNIFLTIFILLFVIAFARILFGGTPLSFTNFLQRLTSVPDVTLPMSVLNFSIAGSWGFFDFLRVFVNSIIGVANFAVYFSSLILNLIVVIIWAVGFLVGF